MSVLLTGGCLCGNARYECSVEPVIAVNCHCRDCQRASGSGFAPTFFVPSAAVTITGDVKYHETKGDSGRMVSRGFCPACGSHLFGKPSRMPDMLGIRAGSLDHPELYHPRADIYTARAHSWDFMDPDLPKFPHMPPR